MIEPYNETEWLTGFLSGAGDLKPEGLDRVKNFLLLWNLFEDAGMQQNANIPKLKVLADHILAINALKADEFKPYVDYFSNRYFNPDGKNSNRGSSIFRSYAASSIFCTVLFSHFSSRSTL